MSPFSLYKRQIADWTEITKSGTRQNQKKINQKRDKNVNCILIFFYVLNLPNWSHYCRLFVLEKSKQVVKELLQKN